MNLLREYIGEVLKESIANFDLDRYTDRLTTLIIQEMMSHKVLEQVKNLSEGEELASVINTGDLFKDHSNVNEVHLGITVNDKAEASIEAYYICMPSDRSRSNIVLVADVPRAYSKIPDFLNWLEADLADALSHELQHSCDSTDMLTGDIPEGEAKWDSLENIMKYYGSDAEVRGHIAGMLGRSRKTGEDPEKILDADLGAVFDQAMSKGHAEEDLKPIMKKLYLRWKEHLDGKINV